MWKHQAESSSASHYFAPSLSNDFSFLVITVPTSALHPSSNSYLIPCFKLVILYHRTPFIIQKKASEIEAAGEGITQIIIQIALLRCALINILIPKSSWTAPLHLCQVSDPAHVAWERGSVVGNIGSSVISHRSGKGLC